MDEGLDLGTVFSAAGFLILIGMAVWHRQRLERAVAALPEEVRERLGWIKSEGTSARRHRRRVARRLLVRGLPGWVPLPAEARRDLAWHRAFGLAAVLYIVAILPAAWGAWLLVPLLALPAAAILAIQSWFDGPWRGPG